MKKNKIIVAVIFILALYATISAMSDDGGQQPVKPEKKTEAEKVQQEQPQNAEKVVQEAQIEESDQETKSGERVTVKDRLGVDTGKSKSELEAFTQQYYKKAEELGIQDYPSLSPKSYFEHKINLNAVDELKNLGLFLTKNPFLPEENIAYNITHSDIIVLGEIDSVEYFYKSEAEEWKADKYILSRCFVKIDEILKGSEFYKSQPDKVSYLSTNGKFLTSGEYKMNIGQKYIFFFQIRTPDIDKFKNDLLKHKGSLKIENGKTFVEYFKDEFKSYSEALTLIKRFIKLNDTDNFYNRNYISKENRNEK
ncbi:MAG TPA: hypothetical protein DCP51_09130 [Clostridiales bacterium]|nr:hypothetical protein [Clostridiales bacterium]